MMIMGMKLIIDSFFTFCSLGDGINKTYMTSDISQLSIDFLSLIDCVFANKTWHMYIFIIF